MGACGWADDLFSWRVGRHRIEGGLFGGRLFLSALSYQSPHSDEDREEPTDIFEVGVLEPKDRYWGRKRPEPPAWIDSFGFWFFHVSRY